MNSSIHELSTSLIPNNYLITLNLEHNNMTNLSALTLSRLLLKNKTLQELVLSHNQIENAGGNALADAIVYNNQLIYLNISYNLLTNDVIPRFSDCIKKNRVLKRLWMVGNNIDDNGEVVLWRACRFNDSLEHLYVNGLESKCQKMISKLLERNIRDVVIEKEDQNEK